MRRHPSRGFARLGVPLPSLVPVARVCLALCGRSSGAALTRGSVSRHDGTSKRARQEAHISIDPPIELSVIDERSNSLEAILNAPHAASKDRKEKIIRFHVDLRDLDCAICVRGLLQRSGKSARQRKKALLPPLQPGKRKKLTAIVGERAAPILQAVVAAISNRAKGPKAFVDAMKPHWSLVGAEHCFYKNVSAMEAVDRTCFATPGSSGRKFLPLAAKQERRAKVGPAQLARA